MRRSQINEAIDMYSDFTMMQAGITTHKGVIKEKYRGTISNLIDNINEYLEY